MSLHSRKVRDPDIELNIELDEDLELGVEFEETEYRAPKYDPCRSCDELDECYKPCDDKLKFNDEREEVNWDDKESRRPPIW